MYIGQILHQLVVQPSKSRCRVQRRSFSMKPFANDLPYSTAHIFGLTFCPTNLICHFSTPFLFYPFQCRWYDSAPGHTPRSFPLALFNSTQPLEVSTRAFRWRS
ncbi:uncharacterized protein MYCFIDRAFT_206824 [Pseudocercospora fijiensis CIRAD86]|uniref:Uncharacterized protein n=1 Tax=Pseudocercospora fijiensis (strain CIRAD86) TaxID=383855 RepID=M3BB65_PSEFD|nr:uncharacterized protein MYCFIDRAFT_206824 [Pseudocercospora fijiensis CIRAD86]EME86458.1 hypothetical protein MYCFIDRAFT_206824 [Pseudocercospora fijiensis CIRAD86]